MITGSDTQEVTEKFSMEIRVKDLIDYLSKYNPETIVYLDHDGWMAESESQDPQDVIAKRGIFSSPIFNPDKEFIILNN